MDTGHTIARTNVSASETATNVVDLNAFRLKKHHARVELQELVPTKLDSLISELEEVIREGERKFLATL